MVKTMNPKAALGAVVFGSVMAIVSLEDLRIRRIPDPALALGLIAEILFSSWLRETIAGAVAGFLPFLIVRVLCPGRLGLGDVKLAAYLGSVLGPRRWWLTAVAACSLALLVMLIRATAGRRTREASLPFAPFLTGSALMCGLLERVVPLRPWEVVG